MPALAIIVMSRSSMPRSLSQYASVPATSRNGRPEAKPNSSIVHAAGCANACQMEARGATPCFVSVTIVHAVRCVVGEARLARDRTGAQALAQRWRDELVVDAPADVVRACGAAVAPPGVLDRVGLEHAETVEPAARGCGRAVTAGVGDHAVEPRAFARQATGILLVRTPVADVVLRPHDVPVAAQHVEIG